MKLFSPFILVVILFYGCSSKNENKNPEFKFMQMNSGVETSLRGLFAFSDEAAVSSGSKNTFLITTDGGKVWNLQKLFVDLELDFRDVEILKKNIILLATAGTPARIYRSESVGESWSLVYENLNPAVFFNTITFWDENRGIIFSDPLEGDFFLLKTADSGNSWERVLTENMPKPVEGEAGFAASGTMMTTLGKGYVWFGTGGSVARVFYSSDYGDSWTSQKTPIICGRSSEGIFSICFKDSLNGVIVGGNYEKLLDRGKNSAWTSDGGKTWNLSLTMPFGFRSCVTYVQNDNSDYYITTGPAGTDYSIDDGKNWAHIDSVGFHSIAVAKNGSKIFLSGSDGRISELKFK